MERLVTNCVFGDDRLVYQLNDDNASYSVYGTLTDATVITVPATFSSLPVTQVGAWGFRYMENITHITLPNTITGITIASFRNCSELREIILPQTASYIGAYAFNECYNLNNVVIPEGITSIEYATFAYCESLNNVSLPSTLITIEDLAFFDCFRTPGSGIVLPEGLISIGANAFSYCGYADYIIIPNTVTMIGPFAFSVCFSLTDINIPEGLTEIADGMLYGCWNLTNIELPNNIIKIGNYAFSWCDMLANVIIPSAVTEIGDYAFDTSGRFARVYIPESVLSVGKGAFPYQKPVFCETMIQPDGWHEKWNKYITGCNGGNYEGEDIDGANPIWGCVLSEDGFAYVMNEDNLSYSIYGGYFEQSEVIVVPDEFNEMPVTKVGNSAFANDRNQHLTRNIILPESISHIGEGAFMYNRELRYITLPSSVTHIERMAYAEGAFQRQIMIPSSVLNIDEHAFSLDFSEIGYHASGSIYTEFDSMPEGWHESIYSEYMTINYGVILYRPESLQAIQDGDRVILSWEEPEFPYNSPLLGYKIYRDDTLLTDDVITLLAYTDTDVAVGEYVYSVETVYEHYVAKPTTVAINIPEIVLPSPTSFIAQQINGYNVSLTWEAPEFAENLTLIGYELFRGETELTEEPFTEEYFIDENVPVGEYIVYYLKAVYNQGKSDFVAIVVDIYELVPPSGLVATPGDSIVGLSWTEPTDINPENLFGYLIYRDGESITSETISDLSFTNSELTNGVEYTYYITAVYGNGESEPCEPVTATPFATPDDDMVAVYKTELHGNYPNPFNPSTIIKFGMRNSEFGIIEIFNIKGQKVKTLVNGHIEAGNHSVVWNGKDDNGRIVSSGLYFCVMKTNDYTNIKKMLLLK